MPSIAIRRARGNWGRKVYDPPPIPSPPPEDQYADEIRVGDNWQTVIDANAEGAKILCRDGTHTGANIAGATAWNPAYMGIQPKAGQELIGESSNRGCILDGEQTANRYAFTVKASANGASNGAVLKNLKITNYQPPWNNEAANRGQQFTVHPWRDNDGNWPGVGWRVENCEISYSRTGGLGHAKGGIILYNLMTHNRESNYGGTDPSGGVLAGNEIRYGNYLGEFDVGFGAGGSKIVNVNYLGTTDHYYGGTNNPLYQMPFTDWLGNPMSNWVHHNTGIGLWTDINNRYGQWNYNFCEENTINGVGCNGIFHEISYDWEIAHNSCRNNARGANWAFKAQIAVQSSENVHVHHNRASAQDNEESGICLIQQDRDYTVAAEMDPPPIWSSSYRLKGCVVENNELWLPGGQGPGGISRTGLFPTWITARAQNMAENYFNNNTYHVDNPALGIFAFPDSGPITWTLLQGTYGQELNGVID